MSAHPEILLVSALLRRKDYAVIAEQGISREYFISYPEEYSWIEKYFIQHRTLPSTNAFKTNFPEVTLYKVDDLEHFCSEVKDNYVRTRLSSLMKNSFEDIKDKETGEKLLDSLYQDILLLQKKVTTGSSTLDILNDGDYLLADIERRIAAKDKRGLAGIPTGFPSLDNLTGGASGGDFWVVGARLGQGKTWTLIRMACSALQAGEKVLFVSLEQPAKQIGFRVQSFLSSEYGKETFKSLDLMKGENFDIRAYKKFLQEIPKKLKGSFTVVDGSRGAVSPAVVASRIQEHKPTVVYIDYLTLLKSGGDDWRAVASLSADIKAIAQRYDLPIISAAQMNREGGGNEPPSVIHLSQSDAIGMDADCVVTLVQKSPHVVKFKLAKFRHGQDNKNWFCKFTPGSGSFEEISGDDAQDLILADQDDLDYD